jgi:hypothetical protein
MNFEGIKKVLVKIIDHVMLYNEGQNVNLQY